MERLQTRAQFDSVLGHRPLATTEHFALHCSHRLDTPPGQRLEPLTEVSKAPLADVKQLAIGAMVPKKWARRAVTRNLIRRQIYSLAEQHLPEQPAQAYVVRLRRTFLTQKFVAASSAPLKHAVREQLLALLAQAPTAVQSPSQREKPR